SGLPHDTTQSELESWFTQFGGRPIAFWTLRTPDQHKPTGTGFAVFSSHEEVCLHRQQLKWGHANELGCRESLHERPCSERKGHRGLSLLESGSRPRGRDP